MLLQSIYAFGWESKPTKIQEMALPTLLHGDNIFVVGPAGGGKTGAYAIGLLQRIAEDSFLGVCQAIVLCPNNILCNQAAATIQKLGHELFRHLSNDDEWLLVNTSAVDAKLATAKACGKASRWQTSRPPAVIVGTLGRVAALLKVPDFQSKSVSMLILDEVDMILGRESCEADLQYVFEHLDHAQVACFSATATSQMSSALSKFVPDCLRIQPQGPVVPRSISMFAVKGIEEMTMIAKALTIEDLWDELKIGRSRATFVFAGSTRNAAELALLLREKGRDVAVLHGELSGSQREQVLNDVRDGKASVLVCSDLGARGVDIHHCSLVINATVPRDVQTYVHRVGRCGRFGKVGVAITLCSTEEAPLLANIEKVLGEPLDDLPLDMAPIASLLA